MMDSEDWKPPTEAEMKLIQARRERSDKISKLMSGYLLKGFKMLAIVCSECETILLQDRQGNKYCVACSELDSDTDKDNPLTNESAAKSMVKEIEMSTSGVLTSDTKSMGVVKIAPQSQPQQCSSQTGAEARQADERTTVVNHTSTLNLNTIDVQSSQPNIDYGQKEHIGAAAPSEQYAKQQSLIRVTDLDSGFPSIAESVTSICSHQRKRHAHDSHHALTLAGPEPSATLLSIARLHEKMEWASKELDSAGIEYSIHLCQLIKAAAEAVVAVKNARK